MRILAVDDEPLFLEVLEVALRDLGFMDFTPIYSASEALRELESGKLRFDCILLDIRMPGMTGVELCRKIRAVVGYRHTPIMMITALTDRALIDDAFTSGASDYLSKPLDTLELKARMTMLERLASEQARNVRLKQSANEMSQPDDDDLEGLDFAFDVAVPMHGLDRIVEKNVIENYLSSLSTNESYAASVFAIAISNAAAFYDAAPRVDFLNMLHDVGVTLETILKQHKVMITYAGSGVFIIAVIGTDDPKVRLIESLIHQRLESFRQIYDRDNLPAPVIAVGPLMRKSLFSRPHAVELMRAAITSVDQGQNLKTVTQLKSA